MRLQQKALLVTLPLILVPTIILGLLSFHYTKDAQIQIENAKLQADVTFRANAMVNYVTNARSALQYLSNNNDIRLLQNQLARGLPYTLAKEFILESFEAFAASYSDSQSIVIYDGDYSPLFGYISPSLKDEILTLEPIESGSQWKIKVAKKTDVPVVEIQLPLMITDEFGSTSTWAYIQLILSPNWSELLELDVKQNGEELANTFMISDMNGRLLFTYPDNDIGTLLPGLLFERLLQAAKRLESSDVNDGSQKIYFTGKTLQDEYLLLFGVNETQVLQQEANITWLTALIVLVSVVIAPALLFYSFSRLVIQPIEKLASAKQQVAQGKLDVKLEIPAKDELGELFAAFNVMVRQLVVYRENERESRLRLEYKVKERTEELEATNSELANTNQALEAAKQISEEANKLKSAFVANISHEIRTPLTAILGFTEQVIADMPSSRYQLDLLGRVLNSGKHLLALINDVLDLSKIESDKLDLEIEKIDIFDLFNDVISIMSSQAGDKSLEFEFNQHYPLPRYVRTDATRMRQILLNLASNAIKFTEEGFIHIDLRYNSDSGLLEVTVTDSGIGMNQEVLNRIFAPFVQADVSISRKFGGTGLGLVISKSLANLLGGDIKVFSEEGKGSEFIVDFATSVDGEPVETPMINSFLDLVKDDKQNEAEIKKRRQKVKKDIKLSGRILIAEDVEDNQYLFKLLLRSVNVEHEIVENGQIAVEKALTEDFDLILMDMQMPIMGGLEATQLLRQAGIDTPIFALTANVMREDLERHLEAGCNGTIAKPIEKQEFYKVLQQYLGEEQEPDESAFVIPAEQMNKLRNDYLKQLSQQQALLMELITNQELDKLKAECHKIKGSAGSYGYHELSETASEKETLCKSLLDEADVDWLLIKTEFMPFSNQITEILEQHGSLNE